MPVGASLQPASHRQAELQTDRERDWVRRASAGDRDAFAALVDRYWRPIRAWLTGLTHDPLAPAWYMTACVGLALIAMVVLPETAPGRAKTG